MNWKYFTIGFVVGVVFLSGIPAHASRELDSPNLPFVENARPFFRNSLVIPLKIEERISGTIRIEVAVSEAGIITDWRVIYVEPTLILNFVKLDRLQTWRFSPYFADGKPTAFKTILSFKFDSAAQPPKFIWRTKDMQIEVKQGGYFRGDKTSQYLHITQKLNKNERGWTAMNIVIPDQWHIIEITVKNNTIKLLNEDGSIYQLTEENIQEIQKLIRKFYPVSDEKLSDIWRELALVRNKPDGSAFDTRQK